MATQEFAADDRSNGSDVKDVVAYIMPQRIQKKMLQDLKNAVKRSSLHVCETYGETVNHIVTQYEDREQVMRQLKRDGAEFKDEGCMDRLKVVKLAWLSSCLKAGRFVEVEDKHMVKCSHASQQGTSGAAKRGSQAQCQERVTQPAVPLWACQRVTPLKHFNQKFTDALEILEKHAEFRNESSDYSRALAFRRASCVLKSLPYRVERLCQVEGLKDVGGHALKVIQSILEEGVCEEVQQITNDWFFLMKEFTSVFGVGPATAKKWIDRGWRTVEDVRKSGNVSKDERVMWGLAFHEDLTSPVSLAEANTFLQMVKTEAENILPGIIVTLTGGFRRGKKSGHDVDILLSHPSEGEELGLLPTLLQALDRKGIVLMGRLEVSTFTPDCLTSDSKLVAMRGQLDHFEKWLGICKFENADEVTIDQEVLKSSDTHAVKSDTTEFQADPQLSTDGTDNSTTKTNGNVHQNSMQDVDKKQPSDKHADASCKPASQSHDERKHKARADSEPEPKLKHKKTEDKHQFPLELARSERSWKARRVDLIVTPYSQYYYALVGWTGNKHFNRDLRLYAQKECNMKLTSHGLWDFEKQRAVPARSEAEVFDNLKLVYRDPGDRNC